MKNYKPKEEPQKGNKDVTDENVGAKTKPVKTDNGGGNGQISELQKQLKDTLDIIKDLKTERETEKKQAAMKAVFESAKKSLRSEIEDGGFNKCNDGIFSMAFSDVEYKEGMTEKEVSAEAKKNYESRWHSVFGDGVAPFSSHGGSGGNDDSGVSAYLKKLKARDEEREKRMEEVRKSFK